jgi:hypothetical protein
MSITDEFTQLQALHENGTLSDEEFTAAKAKVLTADSPAASDGALQVEIQQLKLQNEIIRLDQDWEVEREYYLVRGKDGSRLVPTASGTINDVILICIISVLLIALGAAVPHVRILVLVGALLLAIGLSAIQSNYNKAIAYDQAEERYRQQRNELTNQLNS